MYYKALRYNNGQVEVLPCDESHPEFWVDGVYSFVDHTKDDYRSSGTVAIRATAEEAVNALIDNLSNSNKNLLATVKENQEAIKALKDVIHPRVNKCWQCKHWGSVNYWGSTIADGHILACTTPKESTAHCPFHKWGTREFCRCMSAYAKACEHFEEFKK